MVALALALPLALGAVAPARCAPPELGGFVDGRARFREIYCAVRRHGGPAADPACDAELHRLPGEPAPSGLPVDLRPARLPLRVLVVGGLYGDCLPVRAFSDALPRLEDLGHLPGVIATGGFSSVAVNAARIRTAVAALGPGAGEPLVLVGYSKGVTDALEALVTYPEVGERVTAVVAIAGVVAGTPLADRASSSVLLAPLARLSSLACRERDRGVLAELGRDERRRWLARHRLPESLRTYSLPAYAERDGTSRALRPAYGLLARTDPRNDGAVLVSDAIIPGSKLLGVVRADHLAVALPFSRDMPRAAALGFNRNEFPRAALLEAIVRNLEEDLLTER